MSTKTIVAVVCDRSGREIQGKRGDGGRDGEHLTPEVLQAMQDGTAVVSSVETFSYSAPGKPAALPPRAELCDLHIHCPWLPAVHGLTYYDLCDEDRRVVANLLLQLAMKRDPKHLAEGKCYDGRSLSEAPAVVKRKRGDAEPDPKPEPDPDPALPLLDLSRSAAEAERIIAAGSAIIDLATGLAVNAPPESIPGRPWGNPEPLLDREPDDPSRWVTVESQHPAPRGDHAEDSSERAADPYDDSDADAP